jgi:hypothetical protein
LSDSPDWQTVSFDIPDEWVRPIAVSGITTHNFSATNEKNTVVIHVDDIEVETDISDVDPASGLFKGWTPEPNPADKSKALTEPPLTPLVQIGISTPEQGNVFSDSAPAVVVQVKNWKPGALTGNAYFSVQDDQGLTVRAWEEALSVESSSAFRYPIEAKQFGLYKVTASVAFEDGTRRDEVLTLARVPVQPELTEEQKLVSPYGMNYHGGAERLFEPFKKAGIYWFRDYSFGLEMMREARGADRKYLGWPTYPAILKDYERLGLMVLPVMHGIFPPEMKDGKAVRFGPDRQWILDMADIMVTFPQVKFWELDNEYDLPFKGDVLVERPTDWKNYKEYHRKFGELVKLLGDGQVSAVENGRAGIYPPLTEDCVTSGAFENIHVVNCHHYCGTEPPELNAANYNRGLEPGQVPGFFYDVLRGTKRAASADGQPRQAWLTEFGWDTVAGPAVSEQQQAYYLQRAFLLSFAAGIDKAFWFYNFDLAKPVQIFDSAGLFTADAQPKPSLVAMAGLTSIFPRPVFVGTINAGPDTAGYVFENDGVLIAGLWTIEGEKGPEVSVRSGQLLDYRANPLDGRSAVLTPAPVYVKGLDKADPFYLQTAYSLDTPYLVLSTAGDSTEAVVKVVNNRSSELSANVKMVLPAGWTSDVPEASVQVATGKEEELRFTFRLPPNEALGQKDVLFEITEGGKVVKNITLRVMIRRAFTLVGATLEGRPGVAKANLKITNHSASAQNGILTFEAPKGWKVPAQGIRVENLAPGEERSVPVEVTWTSARQEGASAKVRFTPDGREGGETEAPLIPGEFTLPKAPAIVADGNLNEWTERHRLPDWILGSTAEKKDAKIWLGWTEQGLAGAIEVEDAKGYVEDVKKFWIGDALEIFFSSDASARGTSYKKGDHQFWFVPQFEENRVYAGRWKVGEEIPETKYDLPGVKSAVRRTEKGYVMEFVLPSSAFDTFRAKAGTKIGLSVNLTLRGEIGDREVFWPRVKGFGNNLNPSVWGVMIFGE